jgi:hypothetical protein
MAGGNTQGVTLQNTMLMSTPELLKEVNNAIYKIAVAGQEYKIGSRYLKRADLKELYKIRNDLMAQEASENQTGFFDDCYVAVFDKR